jgi:hypothetical protein
MLLVWWWLLVEPLVGGLRVATDLTVHILPGGSHMDWIATDALGNWQVQAPAPSWLGRGETTHEMFGATQGQAVRVRSIRLTLARDVPVLFTLPIPVFWALLAAAPWSRRSWRLLLIGTVVVFAEAWAAIVLYGVAKINDTIHMFTGVFATVLDFAEYLNMYVAPFLAPILVALALHAELRTRILYGEEETDLPQRR